MFSNATGSTNTLPDMFMREIWGYNSESFHHLDVYLSQDAVYAFGLWDVGSLPGAGASFKDNLVIGFQGEIS